MSSPPRARGFTHALDVVPRTVCACLAQPLGRDARRRHPYTSELPTRTAAAHSHYSPQAGRVERSDWNTSYAMERLLRAFVSYVWSSTMTLEFESYRSTSLVCVRAQRSVLGQRSCAPLTLQSTSGQRTPHITSWASIPLNPNLEQKVQYSALHVRVHFEDCAKCASVTSAISAISAEAR